MSKKNIPKRGRFCRPLPPVTVEGEKLPPKDRRKPMKYIGIVALMLNLGVAAVYAQQPPVTLTYSGSNVATTIDLLPGTVTDEELFTGHGPLGPFTYRELHADAANPQSPSACSDPSQLYFPIETGAGVFRFQDGSLMTVNMTQGSVCVDLTANLGYLTETYQITGGTGRFKNASGTLTLTGILNPLLLDASGNPKLLTNTGKFEGRVLGVAIGENGQNERQ
jgi:hypothetical protein